MFSADAGQDEDHTGRTEPSFYDPFLIIQKTEGKMAEDDFGLRLRGEEDGQTGRK